MDRIKKHDDAEQLFEVTNSYIERGKKEGLEKGIHEGMEIKAKNIAKEMLRDGFSVDKIVQLTELSKENVLALKETLLEDK